MSQEQLTVRMIAGYHEVHVNILEYCLFILSIYIFLNGQNNISTYSSESIILCSIYALAIYAENT